jgi:hypothetical protein
MYIAQRPIWIYSYIAYSSVAHKLIYVTTYYIACIYIAHEKLPITCLYTIWELGGRAHKCIATKNYNLFSQVSSLSPVLSNQPSLKQMPSLQTASHCIFNSPSSASQLLASLIAAPCPQLIASPSCHTERCGPYIRSAKARAGDHFIGEKDDTCIDID